MALNTRPYSTPSSYSAQVVYNPRPVQELPPPPAPEAVRATGGPSELRLHRRVTVMIALLVPLLGAAYGFLERAPKIAPLPAALVEPVIRGEILAADGTILATGDGTARVYPQGQLAAPLLGFTGAVQPDGRYGLEGLEYRLDGVLATGADVQLTIDPVLQSAAERHLFASATTNGAESGAAVILEVGTGRVLAAASYPTYDPNAWRSASSDELQNRAFQQVYEPGSVIKPLVVAGLLQDDLLDPHEVIDAPMNLRVGLKTFRDVAWHEPELTVPEILSYSSNSGMIHLGQRFEPARLHEWLWNFGLGHDVDMESAYTRSGILNPWDQWVPQDQASNSLGQNLSLTPLQLAAAYSVFANDGVYVPPVLMDGEDVPAPHQVLDAGVARQMRDMLVYVMENSGLRASIVPGFSVGGKTGTADVYDPVTGTYPPDDYAISFVGMLPAEAPEVVIVVTLMKPDASSTSTYVAAPLFREIASEAVANWGVVDTSGAARASR